MKKAKILSVVLAGVLILTGCSEDNEPTSSQKDKDKSSVSDSFDTVMDNIDDDPLDNQEPVELGIWDVLPYIDETPASAFTYEYDSKLGGIAVTGYTGESIKVRIPDTFEGEPVVKVDFNDLDKSLKQLVMPDSVKQFRLPYNFNTTFAEKKIENRVSLEYINIPKSLTNGFTNINNRFSSFNDLCSCVNLVGVYIADGITEIKDNAFNGCNKLTDVYIPNSVTKIGKTAFSSCKILTNITIPSSVTEIGDGAFANCTSLVNVTIPDSVINLGKNTFGYCESLTSVTIPNSITKIEENTFGYCESLTIVAIPDSVTEIDGRAFQYCENLTSITLPNSVTSIASNAFVGCENIQVTYKGKSYDYEHTEDLNAAINGN